MEIRQLLEKLGHKDLLKPEWYANIAKWLEWYGGKAKFHYYSVYNGRESIPCVRKTLGMAKKVAEDKADLLLNEKVTINIGVEDLQDYLDEVLDVNNFWVRGNQLIELANALGTGAFVEFMEGDEVRIDYVPAPCVWPLNWRNGDITECAFASILAIGEDERTYINRHILDNGKYVVYNHLLDKAGREVPLPEGVLPVWNTNSETPLFQIVTPNIVNNIDISNPMGVSVYANSIDDLQTVDLVYDSFHNEFKLGKKRIFVDGSAVKPNPVDGSLDPIFDPNDTVFYGLPGRDNDKSITESNMELRVQEHITAIQTTLDILSEKCGFGKGYYKFDGDGVRTATEVVSQNSKLFRKIKKDEIILEKALIDMARAILFLGGKAVDVDISIAFDDSIIEDTEAIAKRALLELQAGIIDNVIYYQRVYGLTEEQAVQMAAEVASRVPAPSNTDFFAGGDEDEASVDASEVKEAAQQATGERLNGAQVKSLMEIIAQYTAGALSESAAVNLIVSAFGMSETAARKLLGLGDAA